VAGVAGVSVFSSKNQVFRTSWTSAKRRLSRANVLGGARKLKLGAKEAKVRAQGDTFCEGQTNVAHYIHLLCVTKRRNGVQGKAPGQMVTVRGA